MNAPLMWILSMLVIGFIFFIWLTYRDSQTTWRICVNCRRFFNDSGEIRDRAPLVMQADDHEQLLNGVCHDCSLDIEFNRE